MVKEPGPHALCPAHLRGERVPLMTAAALTGLNVSSLWRAIEEGRLRAVQFPAGRTQKHAQVKLGDLAAYTGKPFCGEWLTIVEECLSAG